MQLKNKNITVIGMGRTGVATANFLAEKKALITLIDSRAHKKLEKNIYSLHPAVQKIFDCSQPPSSSDLIVLSPGVDIRAPFLEIAHKQGVEIISEIEKIALKKKIESLENKVSLNLDENLYSELLSLRNQLKGG